MKYAHLKGSPNKEYVSWPGFSIETVTGSGAATLADELNRLDHLATQRDQELVVQIEAKNNALRKVGDLEALGVEMELKLKGSPSNRALKQRLSVRNSQVRELLDVLERCQGILADYLDPATGIKPRAALNHLLDVLDDGALVTRINHLSEMIQKRPLGWEIDNGSVELTKADRLKVLEALKSSVVSCYPGMWSEELVGVNQEALRILGASEDDDVANGSQARDPSHSIRPNPNTAPWWATHLFQDGSDCQWYFGKSHENGWIDAETFSHASRLWTPHNIIAGTLHSLPIIPRVGDEVMVTLKRMPDGKQYVSGIGVGIEQSFIVQADQVYVNGACIEKSSISAMELGTAIHECFERVVNNTTNNFGPSEKLKRKNRKLKARVSELENERDELLSEIRANAERD